MSERVEAPMVSVVMITYNHQHYIKEAIEGVLMQVCDFELELIVADDNSPDETEKLVMEIIENNPNGHWILYTKHSVNKGAMDNFFWCLDQCRGKYIAMCEGDDYWIDPLKLQKQINFLEANEDYVITYGDSIAFNEDGLLDNVYGGARKDLSSLELMQCASINTLTVCFRNVIKEFPVEMRCARIGDLFLWSLLGAYGKGKYLKSINPTMYRVHDGGVFSKQSKEQKNEMEVITSGALLAYYSRIGNEELKKFFLRKNLVASIGLFGLLPFIKYVFFKFFKLYIKK